uniref:Cation/H+ exchanger domain-containing protein n=1 Tax=Plectus sambesii TaxID=2011161 RepID=A0A914VU83_9BILA
MTQITMQQTFRTLAFIAETCTFAYLGMAFFTFSLTFDPVFIIWAILLCLIGRATNIFPLSFLVNRFRENGISRKNQFVMWFSGLRGAVAFALALHMDFGDAKTQRIMLATTLSIVLFTIVVLGGGTMPLLKVVNDFAPTGDQQKPLRSRRKRRTKSARSDRKKKRLEKNSVLLSKTQEMIEKEDETATGEDDDVGW